jgi:hypothetical protein
MTKSYSNSLYGSFKSRELFKHINKYCMFIGYPRSGHSLIGSLLDAHPNAIIANELDVLKFVKARFSKGQIYYLLLQNSCAIAALGRQQTGYSYKVPNQWQGRFKEIKVIGDKKGGGSTYRFHQNPKLLKLLENTINTSIKFIHVIRNPYDNISTIFNRRISIGNPMDLDQCIDFYFSRCETNQYIKQIKKENVLDIRHESLINDPRACLTQLCRFLEIESLNDYLNDCASIVYQSPRKSRCDVQWNQKLINKVENNINRFGFLSGYTYDS